MKIDPLKIVLDEDIKLNNSLYFVSGNEPTLMEKVKDKIVSNYKKNGLYTIKNIKNIKDLDEGVSLFGDKTIYLIKDTSGIDKYFINNLPENQNVIIICVENSPKSNIVKKYFIESDKSYVFDCYELNKESIKKVLVSKINRTKIKLDQSLFWFLIDKLDNRYFFLEQEIDKITKINSKSLDENLLNKILFKNSSGVEKMFFQILDENKKIIESFNNKITNQAELQEFFYVFKKYCLLIIECDDLSGFTNKIPRFLFREKPYMISLFKRYNDVKRKKLIKLLYETEKSLRKDVGLSLSVGLRFILKFKKITIS